MSLKKRTIKAFLWNFFGNMVSKGGAFIVSIILARMFLPEVFGVFGMAMVFIGLSQALVDVGFSSAIIQKSAISQTQLSTVFWINLSLSIFLAILFMATSGLIADFYNQTDLRSIIQVMSIIFVFDALGQVQRSLLIKRLDYSLITKISIISLVISTSIVFLSIDKISGLWILVLQQVTIVFFNNLLVWIYSTWRPSLLFSFKSIESLFRYGVNLFGATVINSLYLRLDALIIGKVFSAQTLGLYSRSISFQDFTNRISVNGLDVLFPSFSEKQNDIENLRAYFIEIFKVVSLFAFFFSGLMWLVADSMFLIVLGKEWIKAADYFQILMVMGFAYPLSSLMVNLIKSVGRSDIFLKLDIYKKTIQLPVFLLAFYYSIEVFLWSKAILVILSVLLNIYYTSDQLNMKMGIFVQISLKHLLISSGIVAIVYFTITDVVVNVNCQFLMSFVVFTVLFIGVAFFTERSTIQFIKKLFIK